MDRIFGPPKVAAPAPLPPPPTPENSSKKLDDAAAAERKARGLASNILTSGQGLNDEPATASRMLLS